VLEFVEAVRTLPQEQHDPQTVYFTPMSRLI